MDIRSENGHERDDTLFVASLAKGMRVLECFHSRRQGLSLTEITNLAGIGKSATQRAVVTLHRIGYLSRDERSKMYRLSPRILAICGDYLAGSELVEFASPLIQELSESFGETVNLSQRLDDQLVVVARQSSRHALSISVGIGTRYPLVSTAPGLVMLAFDDQEATTDFVRKAKLVAWTASTVVDPEALLAWIRKIRADGFAVARELMHDGEISVAAPVFGGVDGRLVGAINMGVPTSRWTDEAALKTLVPAAVETARRISDELRMRGGSSF